MIGAIIGDIAGSTFEFCNIKTKDFPLFAPRSSYTDDTLMTIAVASALMQAREGGDFKASAVACMRQVAAKYPCPMGGYGGRFRHWLASSHPRPYGSFGNGSAMRVSPCGEIAATLDEALELARQSAEVTHNHPEGIKGAQAVAAAVYLARAGESREGIRSCIAQNFYPLERTVDEIRPRYRFDETCQGTVPQAITAFLESASFEDALRTAVSLGGDSDTLTDITCAIAWPFYAGNGLDDTMVRLRDEALALLHDDLRETVVRWEAQYGDEAAMTNRQTDGKEQQR